MFYINASLIGESSDSRDEDLLSIDDVFDGITKGDMGKQIEDMLLSGRVHMISRQSTQRFKAKLYCKTLDDYRVNI
ncbi:unnamed protein product [Anisakis simplex]|uniref:DNA helicase n=1 Tax=Anisakis simplex TaxID=6269 RepID=A0A0M3KCI1_ANISI|nr:unnamed protein product [Anisakis simplex]